MYIYIYISHYAQLWALRIYYIHRRAKLWYQCDVHYMYNSLRPDIWIWISSVTKDKIAVTTHVVILTDFRRRREFHQYDDISILVVNELRARLHHIVISPRLGNSNPMFYYISDSSLVIRIGWKTRFVVNQFLAITSLQNFTHATTDRLCAKRVAKSCSDYFIRI